MIKGINVILYDKTQVAVDGFNVPIYNEEPITVENVLVGLPESSEVLDTLNVHGKKAVYKLGIPKSDSHTWEDRKVEFFGHTWHTVGYLMSGIENLIPLDWKGYILVERYNDDET